MQNRLNIVLSFLAFIPIITEFNCELHFYHLLYNRRYCASHVLHMAYTNIVCITDDANQRCSRVKRGNSLVPTNVSSPCEDWVNYNNEKCLKLMDIAGPKIQEEAERACRSISKSKSLAKLITVKTRQEYAFLVKFLKEQNISESVWLGLNQNKTDLQFYWNDGTNLVLANLVKPNMPGLDYDCVEMNKVGVWDVVSCTKQNIAVCEREPTWPPENLQNMQSDKNATELKQRDYEKKIMKSEEKIDILKEATERTISFLKEIMEQINALEQNEGRNTTVGSHQYLAGRLAVNQQQYFGCGNWTLFEDEKCFMIADKSSLETQSNAESICEKYAEGSNRLAYPKLVTVKTKEEQTFLQHFLYDENKITSNVWLGLKKMRNGKEFEWNDGSKVYFNNWSNQNVPDDRHDCVEMESGKEVNVQGTWTRVGCDKINIVVCERKPTWTFNKLQNAVLNMIMEHELQKKEWNKEISLVNESNTESEREISFLKDVNEAFEREIHELKKRNGDCKEDVNSLKKANTGYLKEISRLTEVNKEFASNCSLKEDTKALTPEFLKTNPKGDCPKCQSFEHIKKEERTKVFAKLLKMACEDHDFVFQVKFVRYYEDKRLKHYELKIKHVLKDGSGSANALEETTGYFVNRKECECPKMVPDETYIIMGSGLPYTNEGDNSYQYDFDGATATYHSQPMQAIHSREDQDLQKQFNKLIEHLTYHGCTR